MTTAEALADLVARRERQIARRYGAPMWHPNEQSESDDSQ